MFTVKYFTFNKFSSIAADRTNACLANKIIAILTDICLHY